MHEIRAVEKVQDAKKALETAGIAEALREAEVILSHCLGVDRVLIYRDNPVISESVVAKIDELTKRRSEREPLQYILGYAEFYGLRIKVGPGVLIPRPETELLVEEAVKKLRRQTSNPPLPPFSKGGEGGITQSDKSLSSFRILDLCTGSGCIALALAKEFPEAKVYGIDISENAIRYAKENADINGIRNVMFLQGTLFEPVQKLSAADGSRFAFDLITANPPYIKRSDMEYLQPEVRDWEPAEALNGGEAGIDYYKMIIPVAGEYLKEHGYLICELGFDQSEAVKIMALDSGFKNISLRKDYAGIKRIFVAEKE